MQLQYYFYTFGCKVNACDTAGMQALLDQNGYTHAATPETANVIVCNACTVTASGDSRLRTTLRKLRRTCPDAMLVVTGCFPQAYPEQVIALPEADLLLGTNQRVRLPELLAAHRPHARTACQIIPYTGEEAFELLSYDTMPDNTRAFLKIQDGCNCFCSYCIIPYARGRCRSLSPETLQECVQAFARNGYQEVVLCGINLGFYGIEWDGTLAEAVEAAADTGIERIRLGSLEPERLTDDQLYRLAQIPAFCPQFHISLQSGCDDTLRRMRRKYTCAEYAQICARIRHHFPGCAITTDLMVGFPGETDEDFSDSLSFAKSCGFSAMHVFRYSPRPGTRAATFPEQVPDGVKTKRMEQAQQAAYEMKAAFLHTQVGQVAPVLFERERDENFHTGHTPNGTVVRIPTKNAKKSLRNRIFYVRIEDSDAECCYGVLKNTSDAATANLG